MGWTVVGNREVVVGLDAVTRRMVAANEANWDARAPIHANSEFYAQPARYWFADYEWDELGDLSDKDVLHLQCHLGTETIAFAQAGARGVVGLDLSARSIEEARRIAAEAEAEADVSYVHADVYDAVDALEGRQFDVVYTGKGALCYLPDLLAWVDVVRRLLKPGGSLYIVEFHPLLNALGPTPPPDKSQDLLLRNDYLEGRGAITRESNRTYTGHEVPGKTESYEWMHGLGEVVTALVAGGLRIKSLRESEVLPWPRFDAMVQTPEGWYRLPDEYPRIPLLFALHATAGQAPA